ncbi:MarR family winged helix-turn-helix transcriptional regulator [Virgibacillus halophilus]|uniref:MarR family winged helix-turn-helix transcriptional regulator n=1 Tax=Tigheibacillus halophilus TaxID=361280 RepID=A0ABU5C4L4_9BACI|nr:MarR family winged helix-turn-helix transcriptional regulator [Virgibacillus halophilus]
MKSIQGRGECTASILSNYFLLDKGHISRLLKKFEKKNLLTKIISKKDRRIQYLKLTPKGLQDLNRLMKQADEIVAGMIQDVEQNELHEMIQAMKRIESILNKTRKRG